MAEFEPITTQEQFDAMIKSRLDRAENKVRAEFADYEKLKTDNAKLTADLEAANNGKTDFEKTIAALTAENSGLKVESLKTKIGLEVGIPVEMLSRLNGTTAEEIKADADNLAKYIGNRHEPPLAHHGDNPKGEKTDELYKQMLKNMNF